MQPSDGKMSCPACGEDVYATDQHCLSCGVRLDKGGPTGDGRGALDEGDRSPHSGGVAEAAPGMSPTREVSYATGAGPWDPSELSAKRGFMDSLKRGWAFLKESVAMAFRDKDLFIPSLLAVLANMVVVAALGGVLYLIGDLGAGRGEDEAISVAGYVVLIVAVLMIHLITYFFTGMTVHLVDVHLRGEDACLGGAFADSVRNIGGIVTLALVSLVVGLITGAVRGKGRGLRRAAADTMQRGWTAITYLLLPIMILENTPFMQSTERARKLHAHNVIQIVVGELGLLIAARVIGAVLVSIGVIAAAGSYFIGLLPVGIAVAVLFLVLGSAFIAYVRTAFYTCLYLWAVAMETVGEQAPAPAPLRPAVAAGW